MKAQMFLLALALVSSVTAEALAQFGGGAGLQAQLGTDYAQGYQDGSRDANNALRTDPRPRQHGNLFNHSAAYFRGYDNAWDAVMGFTGSGNSGIGMGGLGMGGIGPINPLAAAGQYNLESSKAAINYQQAYQMSIQNQELRAQTFFDKRKLNSSYRAEQEAQHPHATAEARAAFDRARAPAKLSAAEFDPARGVIQWPGILNLSEFEQSRAQLEELFRQAAADPHGSGLGTRNYRDIKRALDDLSEKLHAEISQFKPDEYIVASKFLKSLVYHASNIPHSVALAQQ